MPRKFVKPKKFFEQLSLGLVFDEATHDAPTLDKPVRVERHYIGWERPLLESAVDFLARDWDRNGALDLAGHLVVVPTRHTAHRIREALAIYAGQHQAAVLPPLVVTPNFFTDPLRIETLQAPPPETAMTQAIWTSALMDIDLDLYRSLFPIDPVDRNLSWAMRTASELIQVRNLLCREGHSYGSASDMLGPEGMETQRWQELAKLERWIVERTGRLGYTDLVEAMQQAAETGVLPSEVQQIAILACPDMPGLARKTVENYSRQFPVDVVIAAPEKYHGCFDDWGNPLPHAWLNAEIELPDAGQTIQSAATPAEQADLVADILQPYDDAAAIAAVGVPDTEVIAPVEQILATRDLQTHDPSGSPLRQHAVYYLLEQTQRLVEDGSFDAYRQLLRVPDWLDAMLRTVDREVETFIPRNRFLERMDELAAECLPDSLADAKAAAQRHPSYSKFPELALAIEWVEGWMQRFERARGKFGDVIIQYLVEVFQKRDFSDDSCGRFPEVANHVLQCLDVLAESTAVFHKKLSAAERMELLLELIAERRLYHERTARSIDLEGWVELLWENAPHLIITGMNDNAVPESVTSHAFLPNSARTFLGMSDNEQRFARDAYQMTVMIQSRKATDGRVDFIFGRQSVSGDPLRPTRLLFQCPDEELAQRTLQFFSGESAKDQPILPWHLAWQLKPERLPEDHRIFERISVTAFRSYLSCPFRFYLKHGLRMDEVETGKSEMNAMEFGNLVHDTLEAYGLDEKAKNYTDPHQIREFFYDQIDQILTASFGKSWTTPVVIQRESARQRMAWWAEIEAEQRRDGWQIFDPECQIGSDEKPFCIGGLRISGRIDRIEWHPQHGYRVFDFKTMSPKDKSVVDFHTTSIKRSEQPEDFPAWALLTNEEGKTARWTDLQLPLYRLALEERFPGEKIAVGYATLGKTKKEVAISMWDDIEYRYLDAARTCAEGVVAAVRSHTFWPPAERPAYRDTFEELFFGDPLEAIDPSALLGDGVSETLKKSA